VLVLIEASSVSRVLRLHLSEQWLDGIILSKHTPACYKDTLVCPLLCTLLCTLARTWAA
jgi:hypothetical protein